MIKYFKISNTVSKELLASSERKNDFVYLNANLRSTFESFMVDTMICYNITILPFHNLCVT